VGVLFENIIYLSILGLAAILSLIHIKNMNKASKYMVLYLIVTFLSELIANTFSITFKNNLVIYNIYSPIQLLILGVYFNEAISSFKSRNAGFYIGGIGLILYFINAILFQNPLKELNTNFIIFECFLIIAMSLCSFYELLAGEEINIHFNPKFWFSSLLLIFWSFTFFYWIIGITLYEYLAQDSFWLDMIIWTINILIYSGFAIVFLFYKKMRIN
jgi:hypothetical protein